MGFQYRVLRTEFELSLSVLGTGNPLLATHRVSCSLFVNVVRMMLEGEKAEYRLLVRW